MCIVQKNYFSEKKKELNEVITLSKQSAFYRYRENLNEVSDYEDWLKIPFTNKSDLQVNWKDFLVTKNENQKSSSKMILSKTSGSSGQPVIVARKREFEVLLTKKLWKERMRWNNQIMSSRLLYLYRNIESDNQVVFRVGNHNDYLDLSNTSFSHSIKGIMDFSPQWMVGPPIAVTRLAEFCQSNNIKIDNMKLVELYGEQILPHQKKLIEDVFTCKVINHYGAREFGVLSYECPNHKMHAWTKDYFFEVMTNGRPVNSGEIGEIVVTSLSNQLMPLIRYQLGDLVKIRELEKPCPCGNSSKLVLEPVGGRTSSLVYTRKKVITSGIFDILVSRFILSNPKTIKEFQVEQKSLKKFILRIVTGTMCSEMKIKVLIKILSEHIDSSDIEVEYVDVIPNQSSGKTKTFIPLNGMEAEVFEPNI
jgi:phenylacetate-CoA ligase